MGTEVITKIHASPETVWAVLTDVEHWPDWTRSISTVTRVTEGDFGEGSQARIKQPRLQAMTWTVIEFIPGVSFVWRARLPGLIFDAGHFLERVDQETVQVTLTIEQSGPLGFLLQPFSTRSARRNLLLEANGLKLRSELR